MLSAVLELDDLCFGGLWTLEGYQRELDSPNSELLGLFEGDLGDKGDKGDNGDKEDLGEAYLPPTTYHLPPTPL